MLIPNLCHRRFSDWQFYINKKAAFHSCYQGKQNNEHKKSSTSNYCQHTSIEKN